MSQGQRIVLDANILLRAVFGKKVGFQLRHYVNDVSLYTPASCFAEASRSIPATAARRNFDLAFSFGQLDDLTRLVSQTDESDYEHFKERAMARIASRDASDWPIIAAALFLDPSGPKTATFSALVLPPGPATVSRYISAANESFLSTLGIRLTASNC